MSILKVIQADITSLAVDCIVNAANKTLLGGGGVDGAIHRAAGPQLLEACKKLKGCSTGDVKMTPGYRLPAKFVIHTVGPVWSSSQAQVHQAHLASCYQKALLLAQEKELSSIAFPSISTGAYGFPIEQAAQIAMRAIVNFLKTQSSMQVTFCCFSEKDRLVYQKAWDEAKP